MEAVGPIAALAALALVGLGLWLRASIRIVAPNERMVIFRAGMADPSLVRGPGRTFLRPGLDRGVRVDMGERSFDLTGLEATTADGQRIAADVAIRLRIVDPLQCVLNVISLDAAIPGLVRRQFAAAATTRTLDEVHSGRTLDAATLRLVEDVLDRWGARCSELEVRNVGSPGLAMPAAHPVDGAVSPDLTPAPVGLARWSARQLAAMTKTAAVVLPVGFVFVLFVNLLAYGGRPIPLQVWLVVGSIGVFTAGFVELPGGKFGFVQEMGWRTPLWFALLGVWLVAAIGLLLVPLVALGLDLAI